MDSRSFAVRIGSRITRTLTVAALASGLTASALIAPPTAHAGPLRPSTVPRDPGGPYFAQPDLTSYPARLEGPTVAAGDRMNLLAVVGNRGSGGAVPYSLEIFYPSTFRDVFVTPTPGVACTVGSGAFASQAVVCTGTLAPGGEVQIPLTFSVTAGPGSYRFTTSVTSTGNSPDVNPANNAERLTITVV
jgi:hypothetical protein